MSKKSEQKVLRVEPETHRALKVWAAQAGLALNDAAEALILQGIQTFPATRAGAGEQTPTWETGREASDYQRSVAGSSPAPPVKPAQKPQDEPKAPKPVVGAGMTVRSHEDVLREFGAPPDLDDVDFEDLRDEPVRSPGSGIWVHHYRIDHPNEGLHECDDADGVLRITVGKNSNVGAAVFRVPKGAGRAEWHFENHEGGQLLAGKEVDLSYEVEE